MKLFGTGPALVVVCACVCLCTGGLAGSCALVSALHTGGHEITVEISRLPEAYEAMDVVWDLTWWDGTTVETSTLPGQYARDPLVATLELSRQGAEVVVVQATARPARGGRLTPLGGWAAPPQSRVALEPAFGRAAEAVLQVARRGLDPALINLERLQRTVCEECRDQPETLDQERLIAALGSGEVTRYAIRRRVRPGCEISLPSPENAVWISNDITEERIEGVWADNRCYWLVPVAEGEVRHLWQRVSDDPTTPTEPRTPGDPPAFANRSRLLTVGRDRDGHAFWFISPLR